jgi:hypothetical protein
VNPARPSELDTHVKKRVGRISCQPVFLEPRLVTWCCSLKPNLVGDSARRSYLSLITWFGHFTVPNCSYIERNLVMRRMMTVLATTFLASSLLTAAALQLISDPTPQCPRLMRGSHRAIGRGA